MPTFKNITSLPRKAGDNKTGMVEFAPGESIYLIGTAASMASRARNYFKEVETTGDEAKLRKAELKRIDEFRASLDDGQPDYQPAPKRPPPVKTLDPATTAQLQAQAKTAKALKADVRKVK